MMSMKWTEISGSCSDSKEPTTKLTTCRYAKGATEEPEVIPDPAKQTDRVVKIAGISAGVLVFILLVLVAILLVKKRWVTQTRNLGVASPCAWKNVPRRKCAHSLVVFISIFAVVAPSLHSSTMNVDLPVEALLVIELFFLGWGGTSLPLTSGNNYLKEEIYATARCSKSG